MLYFLHISNFNPRTPYGMRRYADDLTALPGQISIHAPLTGCDGKAER